jgi:hypothetical protein
MNVHTCRVIPPHALHYNPTPEWPKYYKYVDLTLTSTICIHNQANLKTNFQTTRELQHILQHTTNTHIDTYPVELTPTHYHIKFSDVWKNAPKMNTPIPIHIPMTPLPSKYNHIYPFKYHPKQCIYTYGSFIPLIKNSEDQIEGNMAGSGVYSLNNNTQILE